jgi:hypothetical protein
MNVFGDDQGLHYILMFEYGGVNECFIGSVGHIACYCRAVLYLILNN